MGVIANELTCEPLWGSCAEYYEARANNRVEDADKAAVRFARLAEAWPFEERKRFIIWLMNRSGPLRESFGRSRYERRAISGGRGILESREIIWSVVLPTLSDWCREEPTNPEPHFWLGLYDDCEYPEPSLREAIRLENTYNPARLALVEHILMCVAHNQHEIPSGYLGKPPDDLNSLAEAEALSANATEPQMQTLSRKRIFSLRAAAEDWIMLREQLKGLAWKDRESIWHARPNR